METSLDVFDKALLGYATLEAFLAVTPKKIGSYQVDKVLGKGGMGEVYLACHELLDRNVAIKRLMLPEGANHEDLKERFTREGKALSQLSHSGVVSIFDLFVWRGATYMALEFVDGFDVHQLLKAGALPIDVATIVGLRLAEALEYAHMHRIVHRDIKPANVMVSKTGDVKLMDFGVAKNESLDELTRTGMMVGTPRFLAPEVVKGGNGDERADIYALGCVLYQMLSGGHPFAHATAENIFPLIASGKYKALKGVSSNVPRALRKIVERCLATKPEKRYQTSADVAQDLERFITRTDAWANHSQRLVSYLSVEGHITNEEALTCIDAGDLIFTEMTPSMRIHNPFKTIALSLAVLTSLASVTLLVLQPPWFTSFFTQVEPSPDEAEKTKPEKRTARRIQKEKR
ncbi:MAG: serine/threonine protein kinase [Deltaproteobacteria bacterium]|nr:serine/threonine protein kinase [Deltaproteobacteria bacterium]